MKLGFIGTGKIASSVITEYVDHLLNIAKYIYLPETVKLPKI